MINLIPKRGHKAIKLEYIFRVSSTLGVLFAGVMLLLSVALIPTYVLVDAQIKTFEAEKEQQAESDEAFQLADREVKLTKELLAQLKRTPENAHPSVVLEEIVSVAPNNISFTSFYLRTENGDIESVQIRGQAPTREALASLKNEIEKSNMFDSAEVPISDLARDVDVPFAITATLSKE